MEKKWLIREKIIDLEKLKAENNSSRQFKNKIENQKLEQILCSFKLFSSEKSNCSNPWVNLLWIIFIQS